MTHILKQYIKADKGGTIVEFVFVLPILLNILFTIFELGIMMAIKICLEDGTIVGARYGATGASQNGYTRDQSIANVITSTASALIPASSITTTIKSNSTFAALAGGGTTGAGTTLQVVSYTASYTYVPATPMVAVFFGSGHKMTLTAYAKNNSTF